MNIIQRIWMFVFWWMSMNNGLVCVYGFCNMIEGLGKFRPLGLIVSSRGVISSIAENIHMELVAYDNILSRANDMISEFSLSHVDGYVYLSMIGFFVFYLWAYLDANSLIADKRLDSFSGFGVSRKITNQICFVFIFVFTKDVLYAF